MRLLLIGLLLMAETLASPIIIAHRGASGYLPEHTLEAYQLAIEQGADFIEPDLVLTKDGQLIARHENELGSTTDVAQHAEFAGRRTVKLIDGHRVEGWFSEDFTLAEIRQLRARERIPDIRPANARHDGRYQIPTLEQVIALVQQVEADQGRKVGIYPETKHPTYFAYEGRHQDGQQIGMSISQRLIDVLVEEQFTDPGRVFIQSFEIENLLQLSSQIMPTAGVDLPLIQLLGNVELPAGSSFAQPYDVMYHRKQGASLAEIYGDLINLESLGADQAFGYGMMVTPSFLSKAAGRYADGLGPWKNALFKISDQPAGPSWLKTASQLKLAVHPYTLRAEPLFISLKRKNKNLTLETEVVYLLELGVDGFFVDQPDLGVKIRDQFLSGRK